MCCHFLWSFHHIVGQKFAHNNNYYYYTIIVFIYFFAMVLDSQGLKISKCKNVCPEWLRWGLGNWTCWQGTLHWCWISTEIRWYGNIASHRSAVQSTVVLPISAMRLWALSDKRPSVSTATRKTWVAESILYLVIFLADAPAAALPACSAFCDT